MQARVSGNNSNAEAKVNGDSRRITILVILFCISVLMACGKSDPIKSAAKEAGVAQQAIGSIWAMCKVYNAKYGTWPQSINDLDLNNLKLNDDVRNKWSFSIRSTSTGVQSISAVSTSEMKGGAGKMITFESKSGRWSGYGINTD